MKATIVCALVAVLIQAAPAAAWEPETTHAGLTEQAALASSLHSTLVERFGAQSGLFEQLTIPPADAAALFDVLQRLLNPTHGYVPNGHGRLYALGWLVAGSVIADTPIEQAANHFFDPTTGKGLSHPNLGGLKRRIRQGIAGIFFHDDVVRSGVAAPDWVTDKNNPMNLQGFFDQYARAVRSKNPAARSRHLAGALIAAGAILHVLEDVGSPSHVRNDLAAHYDRLGPDADDVGSRFEHVASLAYGRLGVPRPRSVVRRPSVRAYFTADDGLGLADVTAVSWFSAHTLPRSFRLRPNMSRARLHERFAHSLRRARPGPSLRFRGRNRRVENANGVCLANVDVDRETASFVIEDRCALEQLAVILPQVAGYSAGLLDTLFRGGLDLEVRGDQLAIKAAGADFGAGTLSIFWDDDRGVRTQYGTREIRGASEGAALASFPAPPPGAHRVAMLFEGVDGNGQRLTAAGQSAWPPRPAGAGAKRSTAPKTGTRLEVPDEAGVGGGAGSEDDSATETDSGSATETDSGSATETETDSDSDSDSEPDAGAEKDDKPSPGDSKLRPKGAGRSDAPSKFRRRHKAGSGD